MAHRRMTSRGRSFRPQSRVEWLPSPDAGPGGVLTSVALFDRDFLYDLSGAVTAAAVDFGSGDWNLERTIVQGGVASVGSAVPEKLVTVCLGIGQLNSKTDISSSSASQAQLPHNTPNLSWLVRMCCTINLSDKRVQRCFVDAKVKRKLAPESGLLWVMSVPTLLLNEDVAFNFDVRMLVKQTK